jgi:hypothetical protein
MMRVEGMGVGVAMCLKARQLLWFFKPLMSPPQTRFFKKPITSLRVLLEKKTVAQLFNKFVFYGNRGFIAVFTRASVEW